MGWNEIESSGTKRFGINYKLFGLKLMISQRLSHGDGSSTQSRGAVALLLTKENPAGFFHLI